MLAPIDKLIADHPEWHGLPQAVQQAYAVALRQALADYELIARLLDTTLMRARHSLPNASGIAPAAAMTGLLFVEPPRGASMTCENCSCPTTPQAAVEHAIQVMDSWVVGRYLGANCDQPLEITGGLSTREIAYCKAHAVNVLGMGLRQAYTEGRLSQGMPNSQGAERLVIYRDGLPPLSLIAAWSGAEKEIDGALADLSLSQTVSDVAAAGYLQTHARPQGHILIPEAAITATSVSA